MRTDVQNLGFRSICVFDSIDPSTSTVRPIDDVIVWTNGVLDYGDKVHSRRFYSNIGEMAIIWRA